MTSLAVWSDLFLNSSGALLLTVRGYAVDKMAPHAMPFHAPHAIMPIIPRLVQSVTCASYIRPACPL
ncbi:hypothetical protein SUGI_0685410 [Cryptomeria japonica]|nr:hypothetical protein SUGI_0685410 [Cryptomeria japonica]